MLPRRSGPSLSPRSRRAGLSFLEILFAMLVLTFGIYGSMNILRTNFAANQRAVNRAIAVELARMKAAEFEAAGYDALLAAMQGQQAAQLPAASATKPFQADPNYSWRAELNHSGSVVEYHIRVFFRKNRLKPDEAGDLWDSMEIAGQVGAKGGA
ncbi:hypothetical protein JXA32_02785 [Candidatus Sumerlaeota bacterium]|nr:hypothetical protein [Candidatus Sumerlaeota bacterium]